VVAEAANGKEAIVKAMETKPDIATTSGQNDTLFRGKQTTGTDRRIVAVHHSVGCSGHERTMRGNTDSVEDDPK
jgi:hypothetical protein